MMARHADLSALRNPSSRVSSCQERYPQKRHKLRTRDIRSTSTTVDPCPWRTDPVDRPGGIGAARGHRFTSGDTNRLARSAITGQWRCPHLLPELSARARQAHQCEHEAQASLLLFVRANKMEDVG